MDTIGQRPAQAAQLRHDQHISCPQIVEHTMQFGLLSAAFGQQVLDDPLATYVGQRLPLRSQGVLVGGSAPQVADQHEASRAFTDPSGTSRLLQGSPGLAH